MENELHWVLDVSFREGKSRIRRGNAVEYMTTVRHITLTMLRKEQACKRALKLNDLKPHSILIIQKKYYWRFLKHLYGCPTVAGIL
ncbi:hypothetical protein PCIT_a3644 [Pseudoalteromonas citrea]|uniref:Transposase IS4-like domain-containing protein n=2 Tax=Pseudoalteromonas citrea TaxID=43655 RepID=A0AAD4FQN6_9GAMM|nr:DDE transposase family protein [Pseudoalteromonas citrea]KAF7767596.1 hypothetical protein PCIT_a3644 [Pseudoalteromonas citrea]